MFLSFTQENTFLRILIKFDTSFFLLQFFLLHFYLQYKFLQQICYTFLEKEIM